MHPNPAFRDAHTDENLAFARARGFGALTVNGPEAPLMSHVPFILSPDGQIADMHLVRSTPLSRALSDPMPALLAVSGPDAYVSPDWYGMEGQVPTWNYVAVHLRGTLKRLPDAMLRDQLDRLSDTFEGRLLPKKVWTSDKMDQEAMARMMRAIIPVRFTIESVEGTWKLSQNKPAAARIAAADHVEDGPGMEQSILSALMRTWGDDASE